MTFLNLTPHTINIFDPEGVETLEAMDILPASGTVARCKEIPTLVRVENGIRLYKTEYGEVSGLPEPKEGTIFVVSFMVRAACPDRMDLASPGTLIRNDAGLPVGCLGLNINC